MKCDKYRKRLKYIEWFRSKYIWDHAQSSKLPDFFGRKMVPVFTAAILPWPPVKPVVIEWMDYVEYPDAQV